jgi:hypothetical protein
MNWLKMLPGASLRDLLEPGRWFTREIRREPETMEPRHKRSVSTQLPPCLIHNFFERYRLFD